MAGKLERTMWEFKSFIKDDELRNKFNEIYQQVVEANKDNVIAFLPVGNIDEDRLDISDLEYITDYEILSGTRKDEEGNEFDSEAEYLEHIEKKADEKFGQYKINEVPNDVDDDGEGYATIHEIVDEDGNRVDWEYLESEAKETLERLKEEWIEEQPDFDDLDMEYHEVYWNTVWRFNGDLDREVADKVGLGYLEHISSGDEYLFLLGCGMDLTPKIVAYQALAHGYIDENYLRYFEGSMLEYTKHVMGKKVFEEVVERLGVAHFFVESDAK